MKQCTNCPGRTDHSTADCPTFRADLYADSAQARAGTELRQAPATSGAYDWQAAQRRREADAAGMQARVSSACDDLARRLGQSS